MCVCIHVHGCLFPPPPIPHQARARNDRRERRALLFGLSVAMCPTAEPEEVWQLPTTQLHPRACPSLTHCEETAQQPARDWPSCVQRQPQGCLAPATFSYLQGFQSSARGTVWRAKSSFSIREAVRTHHHHQGSLALGVSGRRKERPSLEQGALNRLCFQGPNPVQPSWTSAAWR